MTPAERDIRRWLGVMATGELAEREMHYPQRVKDGRMSEEQAAATFRIWRAIATLFTQGEAVTRLSWAALEDELARSFDKLTDSAAKKPQDTDLALRLQAVEAMLARIRWHRALAEARPSEARAAA